MMSIGASSCLVEPDAPDYLENSSPYNFRAELEAVSLLQLSLSSAHSLPDPLPQSVRDTVSSDLCTALGRVSSLSTQDSTAAPSSSNSWGGVAGPILTPPPSENLRLEHFGAPEPSPWAPARDFGVARREETELPSYLEPSVEDTLLSVYSPPSSSIASSSSCEDIASIADEKSPAVDPGEDSVSEDVAKAGASQKARFSESDEEGPEEEEGKNEKAIKLPQRKGGMQLWQFLYALLSDPDKKYSELIEWTSNVKEREFRLHEPDSIAIWWGDHKNKRNMSYDKLSRSLRYYYDKGIIRKINGERYVYRFCINPEVMYKHIGNSDCRPKLKPMPQAAKSAMSKYNRPYPGMFYPHTAMFPGAPFAMSGNHFPQLQPPVTCSYPPYAVGMFAPPFNQSTNFCSSHPQASLPVECQIYPDSSEVGMFQQPHVVPLRRCASDSMAYYNVMEQREYVTGPQETGPMMEGSFPPQMSRDMYSLQPVPQSHSPMMSPVPVPQSTAMASPQPYSAQGMPSYPCQYDSHCGNWDTLMSLPLSQSL